jgi:RNA polymerase sigma factor (sigma-70 family)
VTTPEREAADPADLLLPAAQVPGEIVDFARFYRNQMPTLVSFLLYQGASFEEAADIAQYVMTELFKRWEQVEFPKAWIRRVGTRTLIRRSTELRAELLHDHVSASQVRSNGTEEASLIVLKHSVIQAVRSLPARQRQVLAWHLDGYKPSEIAVELGIDPAAVRTALKNARYSVAKKLKDEEGTST